MALHASSVPTLHLIRRGLGLDLEFVVNFLVAIAFRFDRLESEVSSFMQSRSYQDRGDDAASRAFLRQ